MKGKVWAALFILANVADWATTNHAVLNHGAQEANPLLAPLVGTGWFTLLKLILVPGLTVWLVRKRKILVLQIATIVIGGAALWNHLNVVL